MNEFNKYQLKKFKEDARVGLVIFIAYPIVFYVFVELLHPIWSIILYGDTFSEFPLIIIRGITWLIVGTIGILLIPFGLYIWWMAIVNIFDFLKARYIKKFD